MYLRDKTKTNMAHNFLSKVVRHKIGEVDKEGQAKALHNIRIMHFILWVMENGRKFQTNVLFHHTCGFKRSAWPWLGDRIQSVCLDQEGGEVVMGEQSGFEVQIQRWL